jgi:hypothetical protein
MGKQKYIQNFSEGNLLESSHLKYLEVPGGKIHYVWETDYYKN